MKSILVPYINRAAGAAALDLAVHILSGRGGYIESLYVRQPPPVIAGEGITLPGDYINQIAEESQKVAGRTAEDYRSRVESIGREHPGIECRWTEVDGIEAQVIGERARVFDLVVAGRSDSSADWRGACEAALFDGGCPVILAAGAVPTNLWERVVISWNRSSETSRAVAMAAGWLIGAGEIIIVEVEGGSVSGPGAEELKTQLGRLGIECRVENLTPASSGAEVGKRVLEFCARSDASLLIKGAYTQSRFRQMIFGGATKEILENAPLPVLLSH